MKYTFTGEDALRLAAFVGAQTRDDGDEIQFLYCPYCHGGAHKDKYTFAVNRQSGKFNCLRAKCQKQGHFVTLARDMGFALDFGVPPKEYRPLPQKPVVVRQTAVKLLKERAISEQTCQKFCITTQKENPNILVFPFFDECGRMITIKYRNARFQKGKGQSKEWFEKGTKPILFGMHKANDYQKPLVITEGQIDALSLDECGIANATSVPNGCSSFTWVPNCYDWVMRFPSIVVMGDCEQGKITLVERIAKSFPKPVYFVPPESYFGLKDANDILREYGKETLLNAFLSATEYILPHIRRLADVASIDFSTLPRIKSGIQKLDDTLGGFFYGQVILLTGRRGEGKSTFMGQLMLEAIDQGNTVLAYSGELCAEHFKNWLDFQAAGADGVVNFGSEERPVYRIKPAVLQKINDWYRPYALLYDNEALWGSDETESLLQTIESAVMRYGINMVCIDNLMTAMDLDPKEDLYRAQSAFVQKLKQLAVRYNLVVVLVAHPRKENQGRLDNDSVAGSGDITNRVDTVLIYSREEDLGDGISRSSLCLTKNRINGKLIVNQPIRMVYSLSSKRITPIDSPRQKRYGWEQSMSAEERPEPDLPF